MIRIAYITKLDFQTTKAHSYTIAKTCEALNALPNVELTLVSTNGSLRTEEAQNEFFTRQNVSQPFSIVSLGSWGADNQSRSALQFRFAAVIAQLSLTHWVFKNRRTIDVLFARDHLLPFPLIFAKNLLRKPYIFECHFVLTKRFGQALTEFLIRRAAGIVAITEGLAAYYLRFNHRVVVAPCAASEPERYEIGKDAIAAARNSFNLPDGAIALGYTGNMNVTGNGDPYGIEDVIKALPHMPSQVIFVGVGKKPDEILATETLANAMGLSHRTRFLPWVPRNDVAAYVLAFDILVVPASGAQIGNSPTKAFEYLAAGLPIVAANTAPIREVFRNEENALVVEYTDPASWGQAVTLLTQDPELSRRIVEGARTDAARYTWKARAVAIADSIQGLLHHD